MVKYPPAKAGDVGFIPEWERSPGRGNDNPLQYSCLGEFHGQRSLAGYSPWGHKEADMTEETEHTAVLCAEHFLTCVK